MPERDFKTTAGKSGLQVHLKLMEFSMNFESNGQNSMEYQQKHSIA